MDASTATKEKVRLLTPVLIVFMVAMILANLGGSMYGPLEALYLEDLGANVTTIGVFYTLAQIVPLLLQIFGGWLSDSIGRLKAIAIGSIFGTISQIILVLSNSWGWVLLSSMVGAGARSLVGPSFDAFIAENSSEHNRARVYGVSQMLFGIVAVVGPPIGGWLVDKFNFKTMLVIAAILYVIATVIRVIMAKRSSQHVNADQEKVPLSFGGLKLNLKTMFGLVFAGGVITWIMITDGVRDIAFGISFNFFSLFLEQVANMNVQPIGLLMGVFGLFQMAFMIPGGWLSDKFGERLGIMSGFFLNFVAIGLIAILPKSSPAWIYFGGFAIAGIGVGLVAPAYQSLISKAVPAHLRGTAFGLFSTSLGIISLPAPFIGSLLWKNVSPQFPYAITAIVCLLSIIPVYFKFKLPKTAVPADEKQDNPS
jgi:MFS family permease